jgi:hypothetical protein
VERQVVAESVFTALINAFFVSMGGAIPDFSLGRVALVVSLFSPVQTLHVGRRLRPRRLDLPWLVRRLALVLVGLALYGLEFAAAAQLVRAPTAGAALVSQQISVLFGIYAFGIGRSRELLGARHGILTRRLSPTFGDEGEPSATARPRMPPSVSIEAPDVAAREGTKNNS